MIFEKTSRKHLPLNKIVPLYHLNILIYLSVFLFVVIQEGVCNMSAFYLFAYIHINTSIYTSAAQTYKYILNLYLYVKNGSFTNLLWLFSWKIQLVQPNMVAYKHESIKNIISNSFTIMFLSLNHNMTLLDYVCCNYTYSN